MIRGYGHTGMLGCRDPEMLGFQDTRVLEIQRYLDAGILGCCDREKGGRAGFRDARMSGYMGATMHPYILGPLGYRVVTGIWGCQDDRRPQGLKIIRG